MIEPLEGFPLARLTTIGTGGPAEWFARPSTTVELVELLEWAGSRGLGVVVMGSGSNLLVADEGVGGLVLKLDGALATIESRPNGLRCGGGARLPAVAARAAELGLAGIEFAVNIPGTVGGAVRMNANAYGGELARVLDWVEVTTAAGVERRAPGALGLAYRSSALGPGEVVSAAQFVLDGEDPAAVRVALAEMRRRRHEAQPKGIRTFGSTFKNPPEGASAGMLLASAGAGRLRFGGARLSDKHANFVQNTGGASTADILSLMAAARKLVLEAHGVTLEPEVQLIGPVRFPW